MNEFSYFINTNSNLKKKMCNSKLLKEFKEIANNLINPALQSWKNQNGKVIGCMYPFIPEEIISAAGMLPYRMKATNSSGTELSESCFSQINCTYVRHLFDLGMRGELKFLDGVVTVNYCDHIRRLFDNWKSKINTPYMHFLSFPKKRGEEQIEAYRKELVKFKISLEKFFNTNITEKQLRSAIQCHNKTRQLLRKLYELRKSKNSSITGAETLAIVMAGTVIPKEIYNSLLNQLLKDYNQAEKNTKNLVRIMLVGGEIDNLKLIDIIENLGGLVVADYLGYGFRYIWKDVDEEGDSLTALARYQVMERPADPRIFGTSVERNDYIKKIIGQFSVEGIISFRLPQCDLWGLDQINLSRYLKKNKIPYLALEDEYILKSIGQLKTRIQAFIESIREGKYVKN